MPQKLLVFLCCILMPLSLTAMQTQLVDNKLIFANMGGFEDTGVITRALVYMPSNITKPISVQDKYIQRKPFRFDYYEVIANDFLKLPKPRLATDLINMSTTFLPYLEFCESRDKTSYCNEAKKISDSFTTGNYYLSYAKLAVGVHGKSSLVIEGQTGFKLTGIRYKPDDRKNKVITLPGYEDQLENASQVLPVKMGTNLNSNEGKVFIGTSSNKAPGTSDIIPIIYANGQIEIATGVYEKRIGIGTMMPSQVLSIRGNLKIGDNANMNGTIGLFQSNTNSLSSTFSYSFREAKTVPFTIFEINHNVMVVGAIYSYLRATDSTRIRVGIRSPGFQTETSGESEYQFEGCCNNHAPISIAWAGLARVNPHTKKGEKYYGLETATPSNQRTWTAFMEVRRGQLKSDGEASLIVFGLPAEGRQETMEPTPIVGRAPQEGAEITGLTYPGTYLERNTVKFRNGSRLVDTKDELRLLEDLTYRDFYADKIVANEVHKEEVLTIPLSSVDAGSVAFKINSYNGGTLEFIPSSNHVFQEYVAATKSNLVEPTPFKMNSSQQFVMSGPASLAGGALVTGKSDQGVGINTAPTEAALEVKGNVTLYGANSTLDGNYGFMQEIDWFASIGGPDFKSHDHMHPIYETMYKHSRGDFAVNNYKMHTWGRTSDYSGNSASQTTNYNHYSTGAYGGDRNLNVIYECTNPSYQAAVTYPTVNNNNGYQSEGSAKKCIPAGKYDVMMFTSAATIPGYSGGRNSIIEIWSGIDTYLSNKNKYGYELSGPPFNAGITLMSILAAKMQWNERSYKTAQLYINSPVRHRMMSGRSVVIALPYK